MGQSNQLFKTVTSLLNVLFEREEANLVKREQAIVAKNTQLGGSSDGFRHHGLIYTGLAGGMRSRGNYTRLNPELVPEMSALLTDRKIIEADKERIRQALSLVLRDCENLQDVRDALPNGVREFIPGCERLERTRPEAFTLAVNKRSYTQYMALREKIEFYVATRLLY